MSPQRLLLALCLFTLPFAGSTLAKEDAPFPPPPKDVSSVAKLVSENEPGEKLVVTGTVYNSDRKTPLPDFILYVYQTDATGVYNKADGNWQRPRIRGWVKTDKNGRYELRTIKPGSYPGSRNPAHIHVIVKPPDGEPTWIDDFLFAGDPFLSEQQNARPNEEDAFCHIMKIERDGDGTLHCKRDIIVR